MSRNTAPTQPMYPALRVLEQQTPPLKFGRQPYWRAPVTPASEGALIPSWTWQSPHDFPQDAHATTLDVNGAYLSAAGGVQVGHSHLRHTGPIPCPEDPRKVAPGYYRITLPHWSFTGTIVHPLGDSTRLQTEDTVWIAAPTLVLLVELLEVGHLGYFEIIESWTPDVVTDLKAWAARLSSVRHECMDRVEMAQTELHRREMLDRYDAFKRGYSTALSLMLTGEKCLTRRPDWAHAIQAQHAASTWRKAWRYTFTGRSLVALGAVDEITVLTEDLPAALTRTRPPFRYDVTGRQLGALKPKRIYRIGEEVALRATHVPLVDQGDDYL